MKCTNCSTEFEGKFCPECGAPAPEEIPPVPAQPVTPPPVPPVQPEQPVRPVQPQENTAEQPANGCSSTSQNYDSAPNANAWQNTSNPYGYTPENQAPKAAKKQKEPKPFYKKPIFIVIVIVAALVVIGSISTAINSSKDTVKWADLQMSDVLPAPPVEKCKVITDNRETLNVDIKMSQNDCNSWIKECQDSGFTIDITNSSTNFNAFNDKGYELDVVYLDGETTVTLHAPIIMSDITWPSSDLAKLIPEPHSSYGKYSYEHDSSFRLYVGNMSKDDYNNYVSECSDMGFNVDYDKGDNYYFANDANGNKLSVRYEGFNTVSIDLSAPNSATTETESEKATEQQTEKSTEAAAEAKTTVPTETETETATEKATNAPLENGLRKDFKDAMDSYEAFIDEYIAFMEKYENSDGSDLSLFADYAKYMQKYSDMLDKFDAWESEDLSSAETAYYIDVQARVSKKLLAVAN